MPPPPLDRDEKQSYQQQREHHAHGGRNCNRGGPRGGNQHDSGSGRGCYGGRGGHHDRRRYSDGENRDGGREHYGEGGNRRGGGRRDYHGSDAASCGGSEQYNKGRGTGRDRYGRGYEERGRFGRGSRRAHLDTPRHYRNDEFGRGGDRARRDDTRRDRDGGEARGYDSTSRRLSERGNNFQHASERGRGFQCEAQKGYVSHGGFGRGNDSGHAKSHRGRGHYAKSAGGRGRGGAGPPLTGEIEALTNVLLAEPTPNFKFYRYTVAAQDARGYEILSSSRRNQLLARGIFGELLQDKSQREKESLRRQVFFGGTFFCTATPVPGLENLPYQLLDGTDTDLDTTTVQSVQCFSAPEVLQSAAQGQQPVLAAQGISIDFRCADCTKAFVNWTGVKLHCQETGHAPVTIDKEAKPASLQFFLQYANMVLRKAMAERMARWGQHYVDPQSFTTPKNKRGQVMGVNVFRAYHVDFSVGRPTENAGAKLMLTVDLTAKIIRTKNLLRALCRGRDPSTFQMSEQDQRAAKRTWIGQTVISKLDKSCYTVHDLIFDQSPDSLSVGNLGMSHTVYYQERKNCTLDFPSTKPMVAVMGRNRKIIHLPAEIVCANEIDDELKTQLPQITSFTPERRNEAIESVKRFLVPGSQKSKGLSGLLPAMGITVSDDRFRVPAEVLPAPVIQAAGIRVDSSRPNWSSQIARAKFRVESNEVVELNVVVLHHKSVGWEGPYGKISEMVNGFGAKYRFPRLPFKVVQVEDDMERHWGAVETHFGSSRQLPSNVFVVNFTKPRTVVDAAYPVVKKMFAEGGYLSQFVNFKKNDHERPRDPRRSDAVLGGVARQILTKAGVSIWWTEIPRSLPLPALFVGVDVYHSPRQYDPKTRSRIGKPSVAAIVVRLIRDRSSQTKIECYSETFVRDAGEEYNLGHAMEATLTNTMKHLKISTPGCCIVWRDGVSDTAVANTATQELPSIRKVLGEKVPLAMIVCQKRISTKFLSAGGGPTRSLPAGTLVQGLCNLSAPTFYLNGTSPPYSTSKPVRFLIAQCDDGLKDTSLSELTWQCCHEYPNWSGPIKVPAVTQMAHCLAEHAGNQPDSGRQTMHASFVNHLYFL